jgi:hypothetical protein
MTVLRGFTGSKVHGFKGSWVQRFMGSKVHGARSEAGRGGRIVPTLSGVISEAVTPPPQRFRAAAEPVRHELSDRPAAQPPRAKGC